MRWPQWAEAVDSYGCAASRCCDAAAAGEKLEEEDDDDDVASEREVVAFDCAEAAARRPETCP